MATLSISSQPPQELTPAYRPIVFNFQVIGDTTEFPAAISVQAFVNGSAFGLSIPVQPYKVEDSGSQTIHYFNLNLAERVQRFFSLDKFFVEPGTADAVSSADYQASLSLTASFYYPNSDGILTLESTTQSSTPITVINAFRRGEETESLELYDVFTSPTNPNEVKFLTRKPTASMVSLDDSEYLGLYAKGITAYRIRAYDQSGASQGDAVAFTSISSYGAEEVNQIPVGPANINAVASWFSGSVTIDSDTRYYLIQAGWVLNTTFFSLSEIRRYYLVPSDCKIHRIHFINSFGCMDSFTIWNNRAKTFQVESQVFQRPIIGTGLITDGGTVDIQRKGRVSIESPVGNLTSEEQEWLSRDFAMAAAVRVEEDGKMIPFYLQPGTFTIKDSADANPVLSFTMLQSRSDISQRN